MKDSQCKAIIAYMEEHGGKITPMEAMEEIGCMRLAARISDLRREGYSIETVATRRHGKHFATYVLDKSA